MNISFILTCLDDPLFLRHFGKDNNMHTMYRVSDRITGFGAGGWSI